MLENRFLEGELEAAIAAFIEPYDRHRYHESIGNNAQLTFTSAAAKASWLKGDASNSRPSRTAA